MPDEVPVSKEIEKLARERDEYQRRCNDWEGKHATAAAQCAEHKKTIDGFAETIKRLTDVEKDRDELDRENEKLRNEQKKLVDATQRTLIAQENKHKEEKTRLTKQRDDQAAAHQANVAAMAAQHAEMVRSLKERHAQEKAELREKAETDAAVFAAEVGRLTAAAQHQRQEYEALRQADAAAHQKAMATLDGEWRANIATLTDQLATLTDQLAEANALLDAVGDRPAVVEARRQKAIAETKARMERDAQMLKDLGAA